MSTRFGLFPVLLLVSLAGEARAEEPASSWNPFASRLESHPGKLVLNLQAGSLHNEGLGLAVGYMPWGFAEVKFSYAYWTEHSVSGYLKFNLLPEAILTPYIPVGYALGIADMSGGLRLMSHQVFAGAGLQARVLSRFFVAGEVTANVMLAQSLKDRSEHYDVPPSDRLAVRLGFMVGVYLL